MPKMFAYALEQAMNNNPMMVELKKELEIEETIRWGGGEMRFCEILNFLRKKNSFRLLDEYVQTIAGRTFEDLGGGKEAEEHAEMKARLIRMAYYTGKY